MVKIHFLNFVGNFVAVQAGLKINDTWLLKKQAKYSHCLFLCYSEFFKSMSIYSSCAPAQILIYFLKKHVLNSYCVLSPMLSAVTECQKIQESLCGKKKEALKQHVL